LQGSHRIETLLFRDQDVAAAVPWAEQLVTDYKALVQKLQTSEAYSAVQIFEGLIEVRLPCCTPFVVSCMFIAGLLMVPSLPLVRARCQLVEDWEGCSKCECLLCPYQVPAS
jgi:hypothetical protein